MKHFQLAVLLITLLISSCSNWQREKTSETDLSTVNPAQIHELEDSIPGLMEKALIPGLSIAVIRKGDLFWQKELGVKNMDTKDPVSGNTVFEAASLSKPVFAYAVMKMAERDEIDIDKPLVEYVSDQYVEENFLARKIDDDRFRKITTRMVLSHQTGFPNWRGSNPLTFNRDPGERFGYSGEGFGFLQKVIEHITGISLNDFVGKEVFIPLEMGQSSFNWEEEYELSTSIPHNSIMEAGKKYKFTRGHAAASLHTTAVDYARFMMELIHPTVADSSTIAAMLSPQVMVDPDDSQAVTWGLGIGIEKVEGNVSFWHWGDNGDFKCFCMADPQQKSGVVYFTNSAHGLTIRKQITDMAIGGAHPVMNCGLLTGYGNVDSPWMEFLAVLVKEDFEAALGKFHDLSDHYLASEIIPEYHMNDLGYAFLRKKQFQTAIEIFKLNVEIYPESWNVYDSLGEAYMENGDQKLAIENYRRSLEINPENDNAKKMLERMEKQK